MDSATEFPHRWLRVVINGDIEELHSVSSDASFQDACVEILKKLWEINNVTLENDDFSAEGTILRQVSHHIKGEKVRIPLVTRKKDSTLEEWKEIVKEFMKSIKGMGVFSEVTYSKLSIFIPVSPFQSLADMCESFNLDVDLNFDNHFDNDAVEDVDEVVSEPL